jgi:hypothetical protein
MVIVNIAGPKNDAASLAMRYTVFVHASFEGEAFDTSGEFLTHCGKYSNLPERE